MHRSEILRTCLAPICTSILIFAGCAPSMTPPEKVVQSLYAPYLSAGADSVPSHWEEAPVYSKSLKAAMDRGFEYSRLLNEPVIDYDPIANAQDYSITNLTIDVDHPADAKAHVAARFDNLDRKTTVDYDMIVEDGAWKIDGIRSGSDGFRQIIDEALKPIGDPSAMTAPVEAIYERYSAPGKVEPLHLWAELAQGLREQMEKANRKSVVLDLDPVCGGTFGVPSNVKLEAVSASVIAKFKVDGGDRVAVYDLLENGGKWVIGDIHVPVNSAWYLSQKLNDAGIH
jgi:Protein of unknown function (DUF3828)